MRKSIPALPLLALTMLLGSPTAEAAEPALSEEAAGLKADLGLSVDALVAAVPSCKMKPGDGSLVLETGCVDVVCADDPVAEVIESLGATCTEPHLGNDGQLRCKTDEGISFFDSRKAKTRPRNKVETFYLRSDFSGRTTSGLGTGVSLGCFLQELGTPDKVEIDRDGDRFAITEVRFAEPKVWVQAKGGVVTRLVVFGPSSH